MAAMPADWRTWDLGAFQLRAPDHMQLSAGGIDSQAGALTAEGLRIDYDFGLYSDPLERRDDAVQYDASSGSIDGLPARFVRFRTRDPAGHSRTCSGVHVPRVRQSGTGPLSLTVLACAALPERLTDMPAVFASIRIRGSASR